MSGGIEMFRAAAGHVEAASPAASNGQVKKKTRQPDADPLQRSLDTYSFDTVEAIRVEWLWPGWLPKGKLVVLDGDPGLGKSTLTLDWAARVSTGEPFPGMTARRSPRSVLLLSAEDDAADTIAPRLLAAGADMSRVHYVGLVRTERDDGSKAERLFNVPGDLPLLEAKLVEIGDVDLIVVDVLMAYLGGDHDSHKDQDVRGALAPLAGLAARHKVCVPMLRHLNKSTGGSALYRGNGSIGIIGAARVAHVFARDPSDDTKLVLSINKNNLAPMQPSWSCELVNDDEHACARINWLGRSSLTASDILRPQDGEEVDDRNALDDLLRDVLTNGPQPAVDVFRICRESGHNGKNARKALTRLGGEIKRDGYGAGGVSRWSLPTA